jgi:sulfur carrier protein
MKVVVNGEATEFAEGTTVAKIVETLGRDPSGRGIAVAVNGAVIPRGTWQETKVRNDDEIEVLAAVGGG